MEWVPVVGLAGLLIAIMAIVWQFEADDRKRRRK
jgi:hypothetical protein